MKKFVLITTLGIWIFSSFTILAGDKSKIKPVKFGKIQLSLKIEEEAFETLIYVTPLETFDSHRTRMLIVVPEQPSFAETAAGFGEASDAGTLQFTLEKPEEQIKIEIKIDWKDDQNAKPGYVAKFTGTGTEKGTTLPLITGTAEFQEGSLELSLEEKLEEKKK